MGPSLSVVLATYNVERPVRALLDSLAASGPAGLEVCVCDDASRDKTVEVLRSYGDRFPIRLVVNPVNRGVAFSRNRALALAGGERLLFVDPDVRLPPDTIPRLLGRMAETRADVVEGVYSPVALDDDPFSRYYALFVHHSFLVSREPVPYNVFNAWCALCRREVMESVGGHAAIPKGVEVENETLGRAIVARGFTLLLDPSIVVDHHWGGHRKLVFIFTTRVYWWVKLFFVCGRRFESALTTRGYALATLCAPCAVLAALLCLAAPGLWPAAAALAAGFLAGYAPFYAFALRRRGLPYMALCVPLSAYFALYAGAAALYSALEELWRRAVLGRFTLEGMVPRA